MEETYQQIIEAEQRAFDGLDLVQQLGIASAAGRAVFLIAMAVYDWADARKDHLISNNLNNTPPEPLADLTSAWLTGRLAHLKNRIAYMRANLTAELSSCAGSSPDRDRSLCRLIRLMKAFHHHEKPHLSLLGQARSAQQKSPVDNGQGQSLSLH